MFSDFRKQVSTAQKRISFSLEPAPAWTAILALLSLTSLCITVGAGSIVNFAFPVSALGVGVFLYFRYPILYLGFTWWMWLISPFIRRLADYRSDFTDPSPILLTPFLVTFVTLLTVLKHLPKFYLIDSLPCILSLLGVIYGFIVGMIYVDSPLQVGIDSLEWFVPVLFGYHVYSNWRNYPKYRRNLETVFLWGVLVTGIYAVIQFLVAPEWDKFWLVESGMITSQGKPEPMGMRVWSTMNSGEPYASFTISALLLLFNSSAALRVPAMVAGYLGLLLSTVRSAWGGWFTGLLILATSLRGKFQIRLIATLFTMLVLMIPLVTIEPFAQPITARFETFSNISSDGSARDRQATYKEVSDKAVQNFMGSGIGSTGYDSVLLNLLTQLGWFGTLFYVGGLVLLVFNLFQSTASSVDNFILAARAVVASSLVRLPVNVPVIGVSGILLWGFLCLGLAASKFHKHQHQQKLKRDLADPSDAVEPNLKQIN
jgi:hypothetical protein